MVNIKNAVAFGLLAASASAASVKHGKRHHHKRAAKEPCTTTAIPYPAGNATIPAGSDSTSSSREVVTVSVIPVPVSPTGGADTTATTAADTSANTQPAVSTPTATSVGNGQPSVSAPAGSAPVSSVPIGSAPATSIPIGSAPAGSECGVATTYVTVQQTVTVTAGQIPATSSETSSTSTETLTSTSVSVVSVTATSSSTVESSSSFVAPSTLATTEAPSPVVAPSSAAPVSSAPATSSSAASSPTVGGTYTGKKMGTSWNPNQSRSFSSLGIDIGASWCYDWGQVADGVPSGVEYIPTLHDGGQASTFASKLEGSGASYVKHLNEPDMGSGGGGSSMSPEAAAAMHQQYIAPLMSQYNIGFPAVTSNNNGVSGTGWLKPFINIVGCDGFKFFDFHFYGGEEAVEKQAEIFLDYVEQWKSFVDETCPGLPIWISEFSAGPDYGNPDKAATFMSVAGPKLDADNRVARYAYFFSDNSQISQALGTISQALSAVGLGNLVG